MPTLLGSPLDRPHNARSAGYIPTLDGWRAVAVLLVIGVHCSAMLKNNGSIFASFADKILSHAGIGVDIFFSLSGFLITKLLLTEKERSGRPNLVKFYIRRLFRILPPVLLYLAFLVLLSVTGLIVGISSEEIVASLFFFRNYTDGSWYTGHFWSLSVEEHFYLFVPFLIARLGYRAALAVSLMLIILCISVRYYELSGQSHFGTLPQFRTENRVDALLWGAILAQIDVRPLGREALARYLRWWVVIISLVMAVAALTLVDSQAFRRTVVAFVIPMPIMWTVIHRNSLASSILEYPVARYIGRLSFSLYIWQMLFLVPFDRPLGAFQSFPLAVIIPFILAFVSYRIVEKPCIRVGHAIASRWRVSRVQTLPKIDLPS